jgi:hypothetical protein
LRTGIEGDMQEFAEKRQSRTAALVKREKSQEK